MLITSFSGYEQFTTYNYLQKRGILMFYKFNYIEMQRIILSRHLCVGLTPDCHNSYHSVFSRKSPICDLTQASSLVALVEDDNIIESSVIQIIFVE